MMKEMLHNKGLGHKRETNPFTTIKNIKKGAERLDRGIGFIQDLAALQKEPSKGNAIRLLSKQLLKEIFKLGGGVGGLLEAMYGNVLDKMIDAIHYAEKGEQILENAERLIKLGVRAKLRAEQSIAETLRYHAFSKSKYKQGPISFTFFICSQIPDLKNDPHGYFNANLARQLSSVNKIRVERLDADILYFFAIHEFVRSVAPAIVGMKNELEKPTDLLQLNINICDKDMLENSFQSLARNNQLNGLRNLNNLIKLRNEWAQWSDIPPKSGIFYRKSRLPKLDLENI